VLIEQCAGTDKKQLLELGGNAPFVIFGLKKGAKVVLSGKRGA
jgi:acyl-CoA reductase-like NAD-dependent aldehyde dehydrogenase